MQSKYSASLHSAFYHKKELSWFTRNYALGFTFDNVPMWYTSLDILSVVGTIRKFSAIAKYGKLA